MAVGHGGCSILSHHCQGPGKETIFQGEGVPSS